jgi:hypothetical protein
MGDYKGNRMVLIDTSQIEGMGTAGNPLGGVLTVQEASLATFSASAVAFTVAAAATDVFAISGSATKAVKIRKVKISATTTSGSAIKANFSLVKRSTANTGGTAVTDLIASHDSSMVAATAVVKHYTANPTALGTLVGVPRAEANSVTSNGLGAGTIEWELGSDQFKGMTLNGVNESLAVNLNGVTITGGVVSVSVEWAEI